MMNIKTFLVLLGFIMVAVGLIIVWIIPEPLNIIGYILILLPLGVGIGWAWLKDRFF